MKRPIYEIAWFILAAVLSSCTQIPTSESATATTKFPVEPTFTPTLTVSIPTTYPILTNTLAVVPVATAPSKRLYIDPENWYSVSIPAEWRSTNNPNSFSGENGFFETGYLPEMAFMPREMNVCQWLANIDSSATYFVSLMNEPDHCLLTSLPGILPATTQVVLKNAVADDAHRFFYIKADADHYFEIMGSFAWLRLTNLPTPSASHPAPLRPADASFWEKAAPIPPGFSVVEHKLPQEAQNKNPSESMFPRSIPTRAPQEKQKVDPIFSDSWEAINEEIKPYGYELRETPWADIRQLYKNGALLLDNIDKRPSIYRISTPTGEKIAFTVHSLKDPNQSPHVLNNVSGYLIWNDAITLWEEVPQNFVNPDLSPILYQDDPLWLQAGPDARIQVKNSRRDTLFTFATYYGAQLPINGFTAWNGHWILEVSDFVIQDGEILNKKLGFEQVFGWRIINDKPFYFFRKGPRVGISYNGQFLPIYYQDVAHDLYCDLTVNNPRGDKNTLYFLGKRDGIWYDVSIEIH